MSGNHVLIEHGITTEKSDLRCHVCPREQTVYIFPTEAGARAISEGNYPVHQAYQKGVSVPTAEGCWVPVEDIASCIAIRLRAVTWNSVGFSSADPLAEKGRKALRLVKAMIIQGLFPGSLGCTEITEQDIQVQGMDIIIHAVNLPARRVEVKCDYKGGRKGLFLQLRECNPLRIH